MSKRTYESEEKDDYTKPMLPTVPEKCGPSMISLGLLLEFAVQQVYHELTVLSELLPKKLDADRKISIIQFAHSTRTLFVKLLGVVKWVKSSKKFESCASICYFLDQQAQYFVDTADKLVQIAREDLVHARLPSFQVSTAIDVLTLGTYPRLPHCIKDRFISDTKIGLREEACVLARINQVLQSRMSLCAKKLSPRIKNVVIKNGLVNLVVPGEFEVSLTVFGDRPTTKWELMNIKLLVEDYEIGLGRKLIHPIQLYHLHTLLQSRMDKSDEPLTDVYNLLHYFAQLMQLDVLYCQACNLLSGQLRNFTSVEHFDSKEGSLIISYWIKRISRVKCVANYRIKIYIEQENQNCGLRVRHYPNGKNLPDIDDHIGRLSMSRLLSETLIVRCRECLLWVREHLSRIRPHTPVKMTGNAQPTLTYQILLDEMNADELLIVSVNFFSGNFITVVRALDGSQELQTLQKYLNERSDHNKISAIIAKIRILLLMQRYQKTISHLPVRIVNEKLIPKLAENLKILSEDRICLQFLKEENYFLIFSWTTNDMCEVETDMYLFSITDGKANMVRLYPSEILKTAAICDFKDDSNGTPSKRARWFCGRNELNTTISSIDDRISFMRICRELDRRGVKHQSVVNESIVGGLLLKIDDFSGAVSGGSNDFFSSIMNCCLRLDTRNRIAWPFECTLIGAPLISDFYECQIDVKSRITKRKTTVLEINGGGGVSSPNTSESVSSNMIDRMIAFSRMYQPAKEFANAYYSYYSKFCNIVSYTYHKLVVAYGSDRSYLMILSWRTKSSKQYFYLTFGIGPRKVSKQSLMPLSKPIIWNPHTLLTQRLQDRFNRTRSLSDLMQYLIDTVTPLSYLHTFVRTRLISLRAHCQLLGIDPSLPITYEVSLNIIDEYLVRIIYGCVHLEFLLLNGSRIGVRDCARGASTAIKLRSFCKKYVSADMLPHYDEPSSTINWMLSASGPSSLPSHQMGRSPASRIITSPMSHLPSSVPSTDNVPSPLRHSTSEQLSRSRSPILIDHFALQRMTTVNESGTCPLEEYLFALSFINRLGNALEGFRRDARSSGSPATLLKPILVTGECLRMSVTGTVPPSSKYEPFTANLNIYLDDDSMSLKLRIDFEGASPPADPDVSVYERYFKCCVAKLLNEIGVISFSNACRLTCPGAFSAMARIMLLQMDWIENAQSPPWRPFLQLVTWNHDGSRVRMSPGIAIDQLNSSLLLTLCLRPSKWNADKLGSTQGSSKYIIPIVYNMQTNFVAKRIISNEDTVDNAIAILTQISEQCAQSGECALLPAVMALTHQFSPPKPKPPESSTQQSNQQSSQQSTQSSTQQSTQQSIQR